MPTTNPVPSQDPSDLLFNAGKLDEVVSGSNATYTDRLGVSRRTMAGIDAAADLVLGGLGYAPPVAYASGIALTLTTQTVEYAGEVYAPKIANLPFTTSGTFETAKFRLIHGVASADLASGGGAAMVGYTPAGTGAVATTVQSKLRETVSVKDFGAVGNGVSDDTAAIQAAISTNKSVYIPAGDYKVTATLTKTNGGSLTLFGDGIGVTNIVKYNDSDLCQITNTSSGGVISFGEMSLVPGSDMVSGAALNLRSDSALPSVRLKNLFIGTPAVNEFKYGVRLNNCTEAVMEGVVCYGLGTSKFISFDISATAAATVPKFSKCSVYNALYGVNITNSTSPGIEGVQLYGCDIVGVNTGLRFRNTFGPTYFPPHIAWFGGHINAGFRNIDIETASQIIVQGALLYNSGNPGDFIRLHQCSDYLISNNEFVALGGTAAGVVLSTSAEPINGGLVTGNKFSINGSANCVLLDASKIINNVFVTGNQMVTGAAIFAATGGTKQPSVRVEGNYPNTIDDFYINGTWTPTITENGAGVVPFNSTAVSGNYTKIGRQVTITCSYQYASRGAVNLSNYAMMTGLPYVPAIESSISVQVRQSSFDTKNYSAQLGTDGKIVFYYNNGYGALYNGGAVAMAGADFPSAATVTFTATYFAQS